MNKPTALLTKPLDGLSVANDPMPAVAKNGRNRYMEMLRRRLRADLIAIYNISKTNSQRKKP